MRPQPLQRGVAVAAPIGQREGEAVHFATPHPADGRALRYHFDDFMLEWIPRLAEQLAAQPQARLAAQAIPEDLLRLYLEQALYVDLLEAGRGIFRGLFALERRKAPRPVTAPADLIPLIRDNLGRADIPIAASLKSELRSWLGRIRRTVRNGFAKSQTLSALGLPNTGNIAVELVEGADPGKKCDAFWLASGRIDPKHVVFTLESFNRKLVDIRRNLSDIRKLGSHVVALHPSMSLDGEIPVWRPAQPLRWSVELCQMISRTPGSKWLERALLHMLKRAGYWESFFREHGVLVVQQFSELTTETAAKRIAIDRVGGIEVGKMRSVFFEAASAAFHFQHEIGLVWHRNVETFLRRGRTCTKYLVETGYAYDYLLEAFREPALELRRRLDAHGATVVAAVYDNFPHLNGHFSARDLDRFYGCVLAVARRHGSLGLVIKSKKPGILAMLPDVGTALADLAAQGRCIVLDQPLTSVLPSALAADIAFGCPASTAACETALAGCRVFMFDPARARDHPWSAAKHGIVFDRIEALETAADRAVGEVLQGIRGMPRERLLEIDPFLDGRSPQRAGQFLGAFLDARARGSDKGASLGEAVRRSEGCGVAIGEAS